MVFCAITWPCIRFYIPMAVSFIFFLIFFYVNAVVTTIVDRIAPYYLPALPDVGHKALPYWYYYQFNNWWIIIAYVFVFIRFLPQADIRITVFRRWFFVQGIMFAMRSVSIWVTSLSVPQPGCTVNITELASPPIEAFYVIVGLHKTCGDVLFSGHTVALTICAMCWTTYARAEEYRPFIWLYRKTGWREFNPPEWFIRPKLDAVGDPMTLYLTTYIIWLFSLTGFLIIIATRFHYTVDVFLGLLLTILTWNTYHSYVKRLLERRRFVIARVFIWFEGLQGDAKTPISLLNGPKTAEVPEIPVVAVISAGDARPP